METSECEWGQKLAMLIERKNLGQQRVAFQPPQKTTSRNPQNQHNNNKFHHFERDKMKKNSCHHCGQKWFPGHQRVEKPLRYCKIMNSKGDRNPRIKK